MASRIAGSTPPTVPSPGIPPTVLYEGEDLAPPSIDRHGWIWTSAAQNPGNLAVVTAGTAGTVSAPWLTGRTVEQLRVAADGARIVVVSRVKQSRRLVERVAIWRRAIGGLVRTPLSQRRFELLDDGRLVPWEQGPGNTWTARAPHP